MQSHTDRCAYLTKKLLTGGLEACDCGWVHNTPEGQLEVLQVLEAVDHGLSDSAVDLLVSMRKQYDARRLLTRKQIDCLLQINVEWEGRHPY